MGRPGRLHFGRRYQSALPDGPVSLHGCSRPICAQLVAFGFVLCELSNESGPCGASSDRRLQA